ncbi:MULTISPECIES: LysR family transcriptional regulator [Comamonas]|uniref:D-malate degradation protein R n=1 Tax=Comamonas testosteroni TaxID=285 RepID=A0A8B4SA29_COMTE|nr:MULTISPECIES: LysR family transcriptional regulator [Comamonas]EHN67387.1 LysR family transcriptional regulator [Comamonas testosteroni ATCC 11996]KKI13399.1 LysR family transcriptional regulator [Comamonas thiooxydans]QQN72042.1 LysR family transcriptional regulator [Comamonas testosteroni]RDI08458.1 DNA-binding transcriptional LysR family regulator [Comamonas sp. AG1104]SUY79273.1 D-malate degradation protein R [Comamonas testosteroni]
MDSQSLTLLVEIIDSGNLSQAARKLKMTRANVSYHLTQLEKSVGVQLVKRTTRRVEPTEIGMRLYEHGRNIHNEMLAAREAITALGQSLQGRVGISVPSGYGQIVMSEWLIEFKRLYPGIVLDVLFENRADNLRDDVDIIVRVIQEPPLSLVARSLGTVRYLACASREYAQTHGLPRTLHALRASPLITAGVTGRQLRLAAYLGTERHEVMLEPTMISEHFPFLRDGILAGLGVGLVPDYVVQDKLATGEVLSTLDEYRLSIFGTHMYLLYLPNRHQTKAVRTCIDFLLAKAQPEATRLAAMPQP